MSKGFLLVLSGPSGVGKDTICDGLLKDSKDVRLSVSMTTRTPREGEIDGKSYFFVDNHKFEKEISSNNLLEYANVHGNYYGTPKSYVEEQINKGNIVLLEIDVQGAMKIKDIIDNAVFVFLAPPSMEELERRITTRGTDNKDVISTRLKNAEIEMEYKEKYDYCVINEDVQDTVDEIKSIIKFERENN